MNALAPEKDGGTRMKRFGLCRRMESLYRLKALVDETNRGSWIVESRKWRERAEREIKTYHRQRCESVNDRALGFQSELPGASPQVKSAAVPH
jgi:hypothetical protein